MHMHVSYQPLKHTLSGHYVLGWRVCGLGIKLGYGEHNATSVKAIAVHSVVMWQLAQGQIMMPL